MAIKRIFPIAAALTSALISMSASAVDFHGYTRAGMATTSDGGDQICYGSGANAHFVGRLGDECETYTELDFGQEVYNRDNKVFKIESMVAYQTPEQTQNGQGNDYQAIGSGNGAFGGVTESFRQIFATAQGVVGFAPGATLWAGKRYYQRKDVHILDMFYVNDSGYGTGLEGIAVGPGRLSVAVVNMDQSVSYGNVQSNKLDVRYSGIPLWSGATLELIGIVAKADPTKAQKAAIDASGDIYEDSGSFFTAEIQHAFMGGFNKIVLQHGADNLGNSAYYNHGGGNVIADPTEWNPTYQFKKSDRIMDFGVVKPTRNIDMMYAVLYQKATAFDGTEWKRTSVVARPVFAINDVQSVAVELGWTKEEFNGSDTGRNLNKWMVAYQFSAGRGFWARPQIRFYVGQFNGDQAEAQNDNGNTRVGSQLEAWW